MRIAAPFFALFTLMLTASAAPDVAKPIEGLSNISSYNQGIQALADHLPELAVTRFQDAFKVTNLNDAQNREILYRLTEAQVRANQPEKALLTLNSKFFKDHPEREFWIAQSYAAQGRYADAIEHFKMLDPKSIYQDDAILSLASLELAMGKESDALKNYLKASQSKDQLTKTKASTTLAELYLEKGEIAQAKRMIDSLTTAPRSEILKSVLQAKLAHSSKNYPEAIEVFTGILSNGQQLHPRIYQISLIGLADARFAAGQEKEANAGLLNFVKEHHKSSLLLPIFERLSKWTPRPFTNKDPFYLQLEQWANRDPSRSSMLANQLDSDFILSPLPAPKTLNSTSENLSAIALFYYAKHTAQLNTAGSLAKAQFDFTTFRIAYPAHLLFGATFLETAKLQITLKQRLDALFTLQSLAYLAKHHSIALSSETETKAAFLAGLLSVEAEDYPQALEAFEIASQSTHQQLANASKINLSLAALRSSNLAAFDAQQNKITDRELAKQLSIERALWLAHQNHADAREALSQFLLKNPDHQRAVDARIALASICSTQAPLDPLLSKALLDTVNSSTLNQTQFTDYTRTRFLFAELSQEWTDAIAALDTFLERYPASPHKDEFTMRKGLALYRNGEHNKARQLLGKSALENPKSPLAPFCSYYAGMAARLEGTPQALKESVDIFENVIRSKSPLATEARIQQARVLLDINRVEEAKISLHKVYNQKSSSTQQREIGILLATALHTQGSDHSGQYDKAIAIYDQLLKNSNLPLAWSNQVHYMKGQTLESMDNDKLALDSYYSVINRENINPDAPQSQQEWQWFYKCGFKAIALLEKTQQHRAAVSIAKKIASYGGPESEAYSKRARALEMQHMIWEE